MWIRASVSSSRNSEPDSSSSTNSSLPNDETTALLPHERGPAPEPQNPSPLHIYTSPPHSNATLSQRQSDSLSFPGRTASIATDPELGSLHLSHVLSRIDTIEVDLWQNRIRESEAEELDNRLSRVDTCVCSVPDDLEACSGAVTRKHKQSAASALSASLSPSRRHFPAYFWHDVAGVGVLGSITLGLLLYVLLSLRDTRKGSRLCGHKEEFWVAVQMLVSLGWGLLMQVPVRRWMVPFVLPAWVLGTFGTVVAAKKFAGCHEV